ncbi:MAG: vWA domain-containing protein [Candidatus Heimdallarchaeaceae archaeon]
MTINEIHLELGKKEDNMARIIELAERAAKESNLEGLRLIATNYPMIAAKILNKIELTDQMLDNLTGEDLIQLYSRSKKHLNYNIRKKLLEKLIPFITEKAKTIFRRGISSSVSRYVNYQPGDSWEIEMTFEKMLSSGKLNPDYDSIVVKEPSKRKKSIVICIDKSLSVLQLIHQIVLMASVLSLSVKRDNFAIIEFDSEAQLLKPMSKRIPPEELVELILNVESGGKTDLDKALQLATEQLKDSSSREKIIYIISDLERTIGKNQLPIIQRIPDLRIVYARTYRRVSFVDEIVSLPNVKMVELNHNSDLVELTTKLVS